MAQSEYTQTNTIKAMTVDPGDAKSIVEAVIPFYTDDTKKAKYLSYRASGFSVLESCKLSGCHIKSVRRWRASDPNFHNIDVTNIEEVRKQISAQFLDVEFTRNFRLVLQKDFDVIYKSVTNQTMTEFEQEYLMKIRPNYTPQSVLAIKQLLGQGRGGDGFNFTNFVLSISKEKQTMEIRSV